MKTYFAYIRVSTQKQGAQGVSLSQQKAEISCYAQRLGLEISDWFEERETAAKRGRPIFNHMLKRLEKREAHGLLVHKIDRSVRNLRDWTSICDLIDDGIDVQIVAEQHQLSQRGGRLSADIQAVVAADFARNLRLEVIKGIEGRYKQGLLPGPAPLGYLNHGGGRPKTIDPIKGPLIQEMFRLYSSGNYSLHTLRDEMNRRGLTNLRGQPLSLNGISCLLHKHFYTGTIKTRKGPSYPGVHEPLISKSLFLRVQDALAGKNNKKIVKHDFLFSRTIKCQLCGYSLIGERQKGRVYYRCQTKACEMTSIREDRIDIEFRRFFAQHSLGLRVVEPLLAAVNQLENDTEKVQTAALSGLNLNLHRSENRLNNLFDVYLDGTLKKDEYEERRQKLEEEIAVLNERKEAILNNPSAQLQKVRKILELSTNLVAAYSQHNPSEKRSLVKKTTSNCLASPVSLYIQPSSEWAGIAKASKLLTGEPHRVNPRTLDKVLKLVLNSTTDQKNQQDAQR